MKSKAHMKKCLELGVSMSSMEDAEADEGGRNCSNVHENMTEAGKGKKKGTS